MSMKFNPIKGGKLEALLNRKSGKANTTNKPAAATVQTYQMVSHDYLIAMIGNKVYAASIRDGKVFNVCRQGQPIATVTPTRTGQEITYSRPQLSAVEFQSILANKVSWLNLRKAYNFVDQANDKTNVVLDSNSPSLIW